ncbi:MAG TPA: HNH endonuclease signature motif containing protein [Prolixibacteraceae bacterium]|nr:HNH endonuclease signature motif containing protein [Prolixibacteraceae bacterium]
MIDYYRRYQKGLTLNDVYKSNSGFCACGCGKELVGRQIKWASVECRDMAYVLFAIRQGNIDIIRVELFKRDKGFCYQCGVYDNYWEADHIIPVKFGGGGCNLSNYQTLCKVCHKEKTKLQTKLYPTKEQSPDMQQIIFV